MLGRLKCVINLKEVIPVYLRPTYFAPVCFLLPETCREVWLSTSSLALRCRSWDHRSGCYEHLCLLWPRQWQEGAGHPSIGPRNHLARCDSKEHHWACVRMGWIRGVRAKSNHERSEMSFLSNFVEPNYKIGLVFIRFWTPILKVNSWKCLVPEQQLLWVRWEASISMARCKKFLSLRLV